MQLFHTYHSHRFDKLFHSDFWQFEFSVWLHVVARSFVAVFVPILILQTGFSIREVMVYYLIFMIIDVPLNFVGRWLVETIGARKVIMLGTCALIAFSLLLLELSVSWVLLIILAFFAALYDAMYWVAHIFLFIESVDDPNESGESTSLLYIVKRIAGLLGPAIGAGMLLLWGDTGVLLLSIVVLGLSLIPLFMARHIPDKPKKKHLSWKEFFSSWKQKRNYLTMGFFAIHGSAESVVLPLFIFMTFESIESVSAIPIIISIAAIVFSYTTGKLRGEGREKLIVAGASLIALVWLIRLFVQLPLLYYVTIFMVGIFSLMISLPLDSNMFAYGKQKDALSTAMYRNAFAMGFKILFYAVMTALLYIFHVGFAIAALSMLGIVVLSYVFSLKNIFVKTQEPVFYDKS